MSDFNAAAPRQDIELDEGDDETFALTRQDSSGLAIDISGYTFWLTVKNDPEDTDANAVLQKTVTAHTDAANGQTEIDLTNSDTEDLQGRYWYDIQEKTSGGTINTLMHGTLYFQPDVTEAT